MIQFVRTNKDSISILLSRTGMEDLLLSIDSLLDEKIMRVDIFVDYTNLAPKDGIMKSSDRLLGIVKTEYEYDELISWNSATILMILAQESIDYLNFKLIEYRDTGFIFPSEVLELYSSNIKQQMNISILPIED